MSSWWVTKWNPTGCSCTTPGCFSPFPPALLPLLGFPLHLPPSVPVYVEREKKRWGEKDSCLFVLFHFVCLLWHFASANSFSLTWLQVHPCVASQWWVPSSARRHTLHVPSSALPVPHLLELPSMQEVKSLCNPQQWGTETWHRGFVFPVCQLPP